MCRPCVPLALLGLLWAITVGTWAVASVDFGGGALAEVGRGVRAYCFGWDDSGGIPSWGRTAFMASLPFVFTLAIFVVWPQELFASKGGRVGLAVLGAVAAPTIFALGAARASAERALVVPETVPRDLRAPAQPVALRDAAGAPFNLADARGKVVCITFFYTRCAATCPLQMKKLLAVQEEFREKLGSDLLLVGVSIDPERDDPAALAEHAESLGCDLRGWRFLTASREQVKDLAARWDVNVALPEFIGPTTQIGHRALIAVVDRQGRKAVEFPGVGWDEDALVEAVARVMEER